MQIRIQVGGYFPIQGLDMNTEKVYDEVVGGNEFGVEGWVDGIYR